MTKSIKDAWAAILFSSMIAIGVAGALASILYCLIRLEQWDNASFTTTLRWTLQTGLFIILAISGVIFLDME